MGHRVPLAERVRDQRLGREGTQARDPRPHEPYEGSAAAAISGTTPVK